MHTLLRFFMVLALAGFVASLIAHIAGYLGIAKPFGMDPWPLHIGIFIVWIPAVLVAQRLSKEFPQKEMWKATLRGCPAWMRKAVYVIFAYAIINFVLFILFGTTTGGESGAIRGFSGHWLIFYSMAYAILYSAVHVSAHETARRCRNGHRLEPGDNYCRLCGDHVGSIIE